MIRPWSLPSQMGIGKGEELDHDCSCDSVEAELGTNKCSTHMEEHGV